MSVESVILPQDLRDKMDAGHALLVLHVPSPESFEEEHIPGSTSASVYQVTFLEDV